jgi:hypothetical protein
VVWEFQGPNKVVWASGSQTRWHGTRARPPNEVVRASPIFKRSVGRSQGPSEEVRELPGPKRDGTARPGTQPRWHRSSQGLSEVEQELPGPKRSVTCDPKASATWCGPSRGPGDVAQELLMPNRGGTGVPGTQIRWDGILKKLKRIGMGAPEAQTKRYGRSRGPNEVAREPRGLNEVVSLPGAQTKW